MKSLYWRIIPFVVFLMLVIFFARGLSLDPQRIPSVKLGKALPAFQLPIVGDEHSVLTSTDLLGQIVLLNVWASWCAACTDEQLFLLQLAREGVVIYGLNYKDNPDDAKKWLGEWGNPYRLIGADIDGKTAIDLGVYGAPETFLVDKAGIIRYRHVGGLNALIWKKEFLPLIRQLKNSA
jgi:cytochrome c biogenesis protein CcmG/thiol:disulfide interchange protein DsbE